MEFDRLVSRHKDAVYRQMVRVCGNHEDAEDSLVEALLAAHRALPSLRDEGAFPAWLAIVGRRVCGRIKRHAALHPVLSLNAMGQDQFADSSLFQHLGTEADQIDLARCVKSAVAALTPTLREVYELREILGFTAEETAAKLGISIAAVKSRLHRARCQVRQSLDVGVCGDESLVHR